MCLAAAIEAVSPGQEPEAVAAAAVEAGRRAGAVVSLAAARGRLSDGLGKSGLVAIRVVGRTPGGPFAIARTTVVGYDTLEADLALANGLLRVLVRAEEAVRPGATGGDIVGAGLKASLPAAWAGGGSTGTGGKEAPPLPGMVAAGVNVAVCAVGPGTPGLAGAVHPGLRAEEFAALAPGAPLVAGQVVYVEARVTPANCPAWRRVVLGDMAQVTPAGGRRLTHMACRLWL